MNACHFQLNFFGMTDIGARANNEDVFGKLKEYEFFVLSDGMGGHNAGEIAAKEAIRAIFHSMKYLFPSKKDWTLSELIALNNQYIQDANRWVRYLGENKKECQGMGTTICTLFFYKRSLIYGHVGDSRIYRFRKNTLEQLTSDHSFHHAKIHRNKMTKARANMFKNVITRALGTRIVVKPDIKSAEVNPGDLYLMCSDGLTDSVKNEEIQNVLIDAHTTESATKTLIELAKKRGAEDNATVVLIEANEREKNLLR